MKIRTQHSSSHIKLSIWNTADCSLIINFNNGSSYHYKEVKSKDYDLFIESESTGKGFNTHIRKYPFEKIETK